MGDDVAPGAAYGQYVAPFPWEITEKDGYEGTSPLRAFPANGYGFYYMIGDVWEYREHRHIAWTASNANAVEEMTK